MKGGREGGALLISSGEGRWDRDTGGETRLGGQPKVGKARRLCGKQAALASCTNPEPLSRCWLSAL